jgi:hypothetical protein
MPTTSARFSIAGALGAILLFGVGFAALASPSAFWLNTIFTLNVAVLVAALIGWLFRRDPVRRAFWAGFLIAGGTYLALSRSEWAGQQHIGEQLATTMLLDLLYDQIKPPPVTIPPPAAAGGMMGGMSGNGMMDMMMGGLMPMPAPALPPTRWKTWTTPDRFAQTRQIAMWRYMDCPTSFLRIGHSLFSLLFGMMGGLLAGRYRRECGARTGEQAG